MGRGDDEIDWLSPEQKLSLAFLLVDELDVELIDDDALNTIIDKNAKKFKEAVQVVKTYADVKRLNLDKYVETDYFKELIDLDKTSRIKKLLLALEFTLNEHEIGTLVASFYDTYETTGLVPFLVKLSRDKLIKLNSTGRRGKTLQTCNVFPIINKLRQHDRAQKLSSRLLEHQNEINSALNHYPIYDETNVGTFLIVNSCPGDDANKNEYVESLRECWGSLGFSVKEKKCDTDCSDIISEPIEQAETHSIFGVCVLCLGNDCLSLNAIKQNLSKHKELKSKPKIVIYCSDRLPKADVAEENDQNVDLKAKKEELAALNDMITIKVVNHVPEFIQDLKQRVENINTYSDVRNVFEEISETILTKPLYLVKRPKS